MKGCGCRPVRCTTSLLFLFLYLGSGLGWAYTGGWVGLGRPCCRSPVMSATYPDNSTSPTPAGLISNCSRTNLEAISAHQKRSSVRTLYLSPPVFFPLRFRTKTEAADLQSIRSFAQYCHIFRPHGWKWSGLCESPCCCPCRCCCCHFDVVVVDFNKDNIYAKKKTPVRKEIQEEISKTLTVKNWKSRGWPVTCPKSYQALQTHFQLQGGVTFFYNNQNCAFSLH